MCSICKYNWNVIVDPVGFNASHVKMGLRNLHKELEKFILYECMCVNTGNKIKSSNS